MAAPLSVILDRYRLDALIGEGGMANVWRAWDLTLQRQVAVKLLFARDARDADVLVERFLREARIAASVQHRNVIHIVDFGTTPENQPFMVMELLEGETLAARLRRDKRLGVADMVQIANLTLRGLSAVHAAGIIHRDLKPDNVYLKTEGDFVYPKILDFGISRSIEPASGQRSALTTRDGVIVGTPEYMSPEQARGVKRLDYRTDIYSMGVVLYEALAGRLPYSSENVGDLIIKIVTGSAPMVHQVAPEVPIPISEVIAKAMSRNASDRYADATAMQEALLDAAARALGARAARALSDLPPQRPASARPVRDVVVASNVRAANDGRASSRPIPIHLRTTRRPPSPVPRTQPVALLVDSERAAPAAIAETQDLQSVIPTLDAPALPGNWQRRWALPLTASAMLLSIGTLLLWLAPSTPDAPAPVRLAATKPATVRQPAPVLVKLQLRDLPSDALVTLDGSPASATLILPRDARSRSIAVTANGKTPWHISYVANADQELAVKLETEPAPPPTAAKPKRPVTRSRRHRKNQDALRVPDF